MAQVDDGDHPCAVAEAWAVIACIVAGTALLALALAGCAPVVHGGWLVMSQTVVPCPSPTPG